MHSYSFIFSIFLECSCHRYWRHIPTLMCVHAFTGFSAPIHISKLKLILKLLKAYPSVQNKTFAEGHSSFANLYLFASGHANLLTQGKKTWKHKNLSAELAVRRVLVTRKLGLHCPGFAHILVSYVTCKTTQGPQLTWLYVANSQTGKRVSCQTKVCSVKYNQVQFMCAGSGTTENPEEMSYFYWHIRLLQEEGRLHIDRQHSPCRSLCKHTSPFNPSFTVFCNIPLLTKLSPLKHLRIFITPMMPHWQHIHNISGVQTNSSCQVLTSFLNG